MAAQGRCRIAGYWPYRHGGAGIEPNLASAPRRASYSEVPGGEGSMAKLVFELNQSLDGYVDHQAFGPPDPALFRHFMEQVCGLRGMLYGRGLCEVMRYWYEDSPDWDADEREYAAV